ncbi:uncharacterized protein LOC144106651 isoform X2 [Amblyomma americanum]
MYYIVYLIEEEGVAAVPKQWVTNGEVSWPPYNCPRFLSAVKDCELPGVGWQAYKCRIIGEAGTYVEARRKVKRTEEESDLGTEEIPTKRLRKRPQNAISCESSPEPEGPEQCVGKKRRMQPVVSPNSSDSDSELQHPIASTPTQSLPSVRCPPTRQPQNRPEEGTGLNELKGLLSNIAGSLSRIEEKLQQHSEALGRIEARMSNRIEAVPSVLEDMVNLFPLSSAEAVASLEKLLDQAENRKALAQHLSLVGGSCFKDGVRHVMKKCLCDSVAEQFCFTGRKGKRAFLQLKLCGVINDVKETDLSHCIADHLRFAPARRKKWSRQAAILSPVANVEDSRDALQ